MHGNIPQQYDYNYNDDSFDQYLNSDNQLQLSHAPSAIPISKQSLHIGNNVHNINNLNSNSGQNSYDLTFKKQKQFQMLGTLGRNKDIQQNLFLSGSRNSNVQNPQLNVRIQMTHNSNKIKNNTEKDPQIHQYQTCVNIINKSSNFNEMYNNLKEKHPQFLKQPYLNNLLSQYQIDQITQIKIQALLQCSALKTLRNKKKSAKLNIQIMRTSVAQGTQLSQADRHRMEILSLLVAQLDKKLFIQGLRYNRMKVFCDKIMEDLHVEQDDQYMGQIEQAQGNLGEDNRLFKQSGMFTNQIISHNVSKSKQANSPYSQHNNHSHSKQNNNSQLKTLNSPQNYYSQLHKQTPYYQQKRLAIFCQIITALYAKKKYQFYRLIKQFEQNKRNKQQTKQKNEQKSGSSSKQKKENQNNIYKLIEQENLHQQINKKQPSQEEQQNEQYIARDGQQQEQNPIQQIQDYIISLRRQLVKNACAPYDIMKNYFIKWKVFFLTNIIIKMKADPEISNSYNHHQNQLQPLREQQKQYQFSQLISNRSQQQQSDLKHQKHNLKMFIRQNRCRQFYKLLGQAKASKGIKQIIIAFYKNNIIKKAFNSLFMNMQQQINNRNVQQNASYMAENQNQQQERTAKIFYKSNMLAKTYFGLKNILKCSKFMKVLSNLIIKIVFRTLKYECNRQLQSQYKVNRYFQLKRKQTLFKFFNNLKNNTSSPYSQYVKTRLAQHQQRKQFDMVEVCFSALSLYWKKKLMIRKKVENMLMGNMMAKFYQKLKSKVEIKYQNQAQQLQTLYYVHNIRKRQFMDKLTINYLQALKIRKIQVRKTRLQIDKSKKIARQGLVQWRKRAIRQKNYTLIEHKLRKIKQLQEKDKLFKIWFNRLLQKFKQQRQDKLTNHHKLWLNKYYEKLCAIQQEQYS